MYAALSWVPPGVAKEKLPLGSKADGTMEVSPSVGMEISEQASSSANSSSEVVSGDEESELDVEQVLANDLNNLSFYKQNEDDPYLASDPNAKELFDEEELEDLVIRPTDALIVAAKSGDDVSSLEVHLFDDDPDASDSEDGPYIPHIYVHHDIVLPVLPLCTAYTRLMVKNENLNLVAVGMFTPGIDIWDVDTVNNLEPVISLGGFEQNSKKVGAAAVAEIARSHNSSKKKKKPKLRLVADSHTDAVMCLAWNNVQSEYLASGSADTTVKVWDIESAHCACTLSHHSDKVQSVAFHPSSVETLVTGSFDKTVQLADVRDPGKRVSWNVEADVETCQWGSGPTADKIFVATEDGFVTVLDPRVGKSGKENSYITRWCAHRGAVSALSISQQVPGLMVSGGVDKMVKVWDIASVSTGNAGGLVYERPSRAGALFALSLCPMAAEDSKASPFVVAFGGAKGALGVADLAVESEDVRKCFLKHCSPSVSKAISKRAARGTESSMSSRPILQMASESDDDGPDEEAAHADGDSGWESE